VKLRQTKQTIDAYADGLQSADADSAAVGLRTVASFLGEFSDVQMSRLIERGSKADLRSTATACARGGSPNTAQVALHLDLLAKILASGGAKAESTKDLASLRNLLRRFAESETVSAVLDKLRDAMRPEPVEQQIAQFIERLKKRTGTASFDSTLAELAASPLKREHVVAVAMSVYGGIKKSTSRKGALDYIRKPHDAYVSAKRGIDATGGRSAA
jgi:hypothetical protein